MKDWFFIELSKRPETDRKDEEVEGRSLFENVS